jgi:hypothetical protein
MGKKHKERKKLRKLEERSDRRSAEFLTTRFESLEDELADLIPDLRMFGHYTQIFELTLCLRILTGLKKRYQKMSDGHVYEAE